MDQHSEGNNNDSLPSDSSEAVLQPEERKESNSKLSPNENCSKIDEFVQAEAETLRDNILSAFDLFLKNTNALLAKKLASNNADSAHEEKNVKFSNQNDFEGESILRDNILTQLDSFKNHVSASFSKKTKSKLADEDENKKSSDSNDFSKIKIDDQAEPKSCIFSTEEKAKNELGVIIENSDNNVQLESTEKRKGSPNCCPSSSVRANYAQDIIPEAFRHYQRSPRCADHKLRRSLSWHDLRDIQREPLSDSATVVVNPSWQHFEDKQRESVEDNYGSELKSDPNCDSELKSDPNCDSEIKSDPNCDSELKSGSGFSSELKSEFVDDPNDNKLKGKEVRSQVGQFKGNESRRIPINENSQFRSNYYQKHVAEFNKPPFRSVFNPKAI